MENERKAYVVMATSHVSYAAGQAEASWPLVVFDSSEPAEAHCCIMRAQAEEERAKSGYRGVTMEYDINIVPLLITGGTE